MYVFLQRISLMVSRGLSAIFLVFVMLGSAPAIAYAQQFSQSQGDATKINLVHRAQQISMQDMYSRALYQHIRSNPTAFDNPQFYANFLIFLMTRTPEFNCQKAFANEFERRDFFTQSFQLQGQIKQIVNSVTIPHRFEIAYAVNTGRYEFATGRLPFDRLQEISISHGLSHSISDNNARNCASIILQGTSVEVNQFPWSFQVVNEAGESSRPEFPFGNEMVLPDSDARTLFGQFGRQLYAIVSYQFQAANNGEAKVQIIATDGHLFGLSSDAVVRVKSHRHPRLSQPNYLGMTHPLSVEIAELGLDASLTFQQQGFRAVGKGTREDPGTDITLGGTVPISGSAAVGDSLFVMRLATPRLMNRVPGLPQLQAGSERFLTLIGAVDYEKISAQQAPVSGTVLILQVEQSGEMRESRGLRFSGAFTPAEAAASKDDPAKENATAEAAAQEN